MQIAVKEYGLFDLITVSGRVDSVEAARLAQALTEANDRGQYKLVIDMSQLAYMSSAGLRALTTAQRNSKRKGGEVILAQITENVREVLEVVGFTTFFKIMDDVASAMEFAAQSPSNGNRTGGQSPSV